MRRLEFKKKNNVFFRSRFCEIETWNAKITLHAYREEGQIKKTNKLLIKTLILMRLMRKLEKKDDKRQLAVLTRTKLLINF